MAGIPGGDPFVDQIPPGGGTLGDPVVTVKRVQNAITQNPQRTGGKIPVRDLRIAVLATRRSPQARSSLKNVRMT